MPTTTLSSARPTPEITRLIRDGWMPIGVRRVDRREWLMFGWMCKFQYQGIVYRMFFGDGVCGGQRRALWAAAAWIESARRSKKCSQKMKKAWGARA